MEEGKKKALQIIIPFSLLTSLCIVFFSECLIHIFSNDLEVISIGSEYLKMEGNFYIGIGLLFFLYGYFRAIKKPSVSILLTIISLGLRVVISYCLSPVFGYTIIWLSIPIGWITADLAGFLLLTTIKGGILVSMLFIAFKLTSYMGNFSFMIDFLKEIIALLWNSFLSLGI